MAESKRIRYLREKMALPKKILLQNYRFYISKKNKDTYYTQLLLPKTVLTADEYIDIMKRL